MNPQKPADGIMMSYEYPDVKAFRVQCSCHNPSDRIDVIVETDEFGEVIITFDVEAKTAWWKELCSWEVYKIDNPILYFFVNSIKSLINGLYQRIRLTKDIWWNGYIDYNATVLLNKQRALNFAETLKIAIKDFENDKH